jgi:Tol biopolymer transport system component
VTSDATDGYLRPAWTPDGSRILASGVEDGLPVMYLMDPDGSNREVFETGDALGAFGVFTPDGEHVVFTDGADLWSIAIDGTDLRRLTVHPLPDGVPSVGVRVEDG